MTNVKKHVELPQNQLLPSLVAFSEIENQQIEQYVRFKRTKKDEANHFDNLQIPLGKALKASITYRRDPEVKNGKYYEQQIRFYRKSSAKKITNILETRYSRISVSHSRVTVTMSFPLCDDPQRLTARLQNFANIIIDESDEIAAMLNQEGADKVQEAWQEIDAMNEKIQEEE